mmetsp:Transcript_9475/g.40236  ORF Transcript_9475/g.40236 Transcript_9475/m.40236 type:complete len:208 (-) Transcript_9475:148-771(-)
MAPSHASPEASPRTPRTPSGSRPNTFAAGTFTGNENWPGATHSFALGHRSSAGFAKILCSSAYVGTTTCFTGPTDSASSKNSLVGARGAWTHVVPSLSLITTQRRGVSRGPSARFCSSAYTSPGTISIKRVSRESSPYRGAKSVGTSWKYDRGSTGLSPAPVASAPPAAEASGAETAAASTARREEARVRFAGSLATASVVDAPREL